MGPLDLRRGVVPQLSPEKGVPHSEARALEIGSPWIGNGVRVPLCGVWREEVGD